MKSLEPAPCSRIFFPLFLLAVSSHFAVSSLTFDCMCPQSQWEKVGRGLWSEWMSPFDNKLLDLRVAGSSLEGFVVEAEEDIFPYRIILLVLGLVLLTFAPLLSKSLVFYYSSAMAVGIILVILMVLFQGMRLLPTGRRNSLAIFFYSSVIGLGSFLLRYVPGLIRSLLVELGISEEMYNPVYSNVPRDFSSSCWSLVGFLGYPKICLYRRWIC